MVMIVSFTYQKERLKVNLKPDKNKILIYRMRSNITHSGLL